jgi:hypothetical protein
MSFIFSYCKALVPVSVKRMAAHDKSPAGAELTKKEKVALMDAKLKAFMNIYIDISLAIEFV